MSGASAGAAPGAKARVKREPCTHTEGESKLCKRCHKTLCPKCWSSLIDGSVDHIAHNKKTCAQCRAQSAQHQKQKRQSEASDPSRGAKRLKRESGAHAPGPGASGEFVNQCLSSRAVLVSWQPPAASPPSPVSSSLPPLTPYDFRPATFFLDRACDS